MTPQDSSSVKIALAQCEAIIRARGGVPPDQMVLTVEGKKGDEAVNTLAKILTDRGIDVYGVRFFRPGFETWAKAAGMPLTSDSISLWADLLWDQLPFNAEMEEGLMYKLRWINGKWRNWKP